MNVFFDKLAAFVVFRRWLTVLVLIGITLLAIVGHTDPRFFHKLFASEQASSESSSGRRISEFSEAPPNVDPINISSANAILVVRSPNFFTSEAAKATRQVVDDLESLDQVAFILWMDRVPTLNIFGLNEPIYPRSVASEQRFAASKKKALAHPLVKGQLLSEDGQTMLMMITYDRNHIISNDDATGLLRRTAEKSAEGFPDAQLSFQVTGDFPARLAAIEQHESNQWLSLIHI